MKTGTRVKHRFLLHRYCVLRQLKFIRHFESDVAIVEKVAIAMYCNLRPPDVAPVVLRFNYEDYNAATHQISTILIEQCACVTDDSADFS